MGEPRTENSICALPLPPGFTSASSATLFLSRARCLTQSSVFLLHIYIYKFVCLYVRRSTNLLRKRKLEKSRKYQCAAPRRAAPSIAPKEQEKECYSIGYQNIVGVKWAHEAFEQRLYKRGAYWSRALVIAWIYFNFKFVKVKMTNEYRETWLDSRR